MNPTQFLAFVSFGMSGRSTTTALLRVGGFVLCCILTVIIRDVHGATLYPADRLSIVEGAGFLMYLVPDHAVGDSMEVISRCSLTLRDQSYNLDTDKVYTIGQSTTVQRFSADVCGIRVHNVRASSETAWTITALDDRSNQVNHTMTLTINSKSASR
uniref:(northern house mosquito) hypothetical protein n=1 Tax=Culex pipiens TaxID=7175 RepID=A0A8D8FML0_CULPI